MSPTQRSKHYLEHLGYRVAIVEKWNPFARVRQDLFGVDVLALKPGTPILAVQVTTGAHHADRREKLHAEGFVALWQGTGATLELWSWRKAGPRGQRQTWQLRREAL
jgi:hypothetical protein